MVGRYDRITESSRMVPVQLRSAHRRHPLAPHQPLREPVTDAGVSRGGTRTVGVVAGEGRGGRRGGAAVYCYTHIQTQWKLKYEVDTSEVTIRKNI